MSEKSINKKYINILVFIALIIIPFIAEIFLFNSFYFKLNESEKGKINLSDKDFTFSNNDSISNNTIILNGDETEFKINNNKYIAYLKIDLSNESDNFIIETNKKIKGTNETIKYNGNTKVKDSIFIAVNDSSDNVSFKVKRISDEASKNEKNQLKFEGISIDNTFTFNYLRVLLVFTIIAIVSIFTVYRGYFKGKIHLYFLVIATLIGVNISLSTPTYYNYDEKEHFVRAYQISNLQLGLRSNVPSKWVDDIDLFYASHGSGSSDFYSFKEREAYLDKLKSTNYSKEKYYHTTASTYWFVPYIPAGIGILVGKIIGLPFIYTFYLGRIFNLLAYILICFLSIKYVNFAKRTITMVALLPAVLNISSGYTIDGITISCAIAAVSIFLNMISSKNKTIGIKEIILFIMSICITILSKVSYAPLCLLIFAVPKEKFRQIRDFKYYHLYIKLGILSLSGVTTLLTFIYANKKDLNQWQMEGVSISGQVKFIINNIFEYIEIVIRSFFDNAIAYFDGLTSALAYSGNIKPIWVLVLVVALVVVVIIDYEDETVSLTVNSKLILASSVCLSWGLVVTALYVTFNKVGSNSIVGVQGRYLAPIILPVLLLMKNKKIENSFDKNNFTTVILILITMPLISVIVKLFLQYCS